MQWSPPSFYHECTSADSSRWTTFAQGTEESDGWQNLVSTVIEIFKMTKETQRRRRVPRERERGEEEEVHPHLEFFWLDALRFGPLSCPWENESPLVPNAFAERRWDSLFRMFQHVGGVASRRTAEDAWGSWRDCWTCCLPLLKTDRAFNSMRAWRLGLMHEKNMYNNQRISKNKPGSSSTYSYFKEYNVNFNKNN